MKNKLIKGLVTAGLLGVATAASAQSVTFNLTGTIQQGTCGFSVPDTDIGTFGAWTFTGVGYTAPWSSNIPVTASGCTADISTIHMIFDGTADSTNSQYFKVSPLSGPTTLDGVAIELSTATGTAARLVPNTNTIDWSLGSIGNVFYIKGRFVQTLATVTPGQMKTPITVQFNYN